MNFGPKTLYFQIFVVKAHFNWRLSNPIQSNHLQLMVLHRSIANLFYRQQICSIDRKYVLSIENIFQQSMANLFYRQQICSIDRKSVLSIEQICYQKKRFSIDRTYAVLSRNPVCRDLRAHRQLFKDCCGHRQLRKFCWSGRVRSMLN